MPTGKPSTYQQVTDRIVAALEAGTIPWHRPWRSGLPRNAVSGREYRGVNSLLLQLTALERGYESSRWLTYRQAQQLGGNVCRGEKATQVVWWSQAERKSEDQDSEPERYWLARTYHVFNVDQTSGLDAVHDKMARPSSPVPATWEQLVSRYEIDIRHGGDRAFYDPQGDYVQMPPAALFESTDRYYGVLAHELVHSTGAPHRLNRDLSGRFGSERYAMEELVAELGSAFLTAHCGLPYATQANAAYIQSWLRVLRDDSRAVFTAARLATRAAEYICPPTPAAQPTGEPYMTAA